MKNFAPIQKNAFRIAFASLAVCAALSTVARADEARELRVGYADLNVNSEAGAAVLFQRIRHAADRVCELPGTRDLGQLAAVKSCTDHAIATAVEAVKAPALTRVYDAKFGVLPAVTVLASR
jgi:UrcA family protein